MEGYCPLASGSKGNAIYIGSKQTKLLIDAGISAKAVQDRLNLLGVSLQEIDAILITHEHSDHIRGLSSLAVKYKIPVFANSDTAQAILETLDETPKFKIFSTGETFEFGDMEIHPFTIQHDTLDPVAFTIRIDLLKLGFCTDLGFATTLVKNHLKGCDYLYIESNHDPSMLHASSRREIEKQRILSRQGHLSNQQCAQLITEVAHPGLKHIHLAHLSEECNHPDKALKTAQEALDSLCLPTTLSIAHQNQVSQAIRF